MIRMLLLLRTMSAFQEPSSKVARAISTVLKTRSLEEKFARNAT